MYRNRKGFTIVELVIVIAVIAILAAVLIPTFSSLTQRANLNSDMQAVRQMNMALQNDEALNGKCTNVEQAMQVIANAGYNVDNQWTCLTEGYQVYWNKTDNRCVLYNSTTAKVEYPKDYEAEDLMANVNNLYWEYNAVYKQAINADLGFGSQGAVVVTEGVGFTSSSSADVYVTLGSQNATISADVTSAFGSIGITAESSKLYGYVQEEKAGVTLDKYAIYDASQSFTSDTDVKPNVYYISVDPDADQATASKEVGKVVQAIFVQMNADMVSNDANVVIAGGTTIDISDNGGDWKPVGLFKGYFGTTDATKPIVINGLTLSTATAYNVPGIHKFEGSKSTYYMTGFFGAITSDANEKTVIENVTFKNVHIKNPAQDSSLVAADNDHNAVRISNDSNCTAIIGGIVSTVNNLKVNVTLRNIDVVDSSVQGVARVGGLVAYIGGFSGNNARGLQGEINIVDCDVDCDVTTTKQNAYGTCGGIVGFINKTDYEEAYGGTLNINITNCTFEGTLTGVYCGGIVAQYSPTHENGGTDSNTVTLTISNCTAEEAKFVLNYGQKLNDKGDIVRIKSFYGAIIGKVETISATKKCSKNGVEVVQKTADEEGILVESLDGETVESTN